MQYLQRHISKTKIMLFMMTFVSSITLAQNKVTVKGFVVDTTNVPVSFANVVILEKDTNTIINGAITDENGRFTIKVAKGTYTLKITFLGYEDYQQEINTNITLDIGKIELQENLNELDAVVIKAKREMISRRGDKLLMKIENNAFAEGKSAAEILKYAPNVWVDPNSDAISIKGLSATIMIDGKRTNMSSADLMNYLSSLADNELKTIEIISNPSARYDAEGLGGIINIVTNRKNKKGLNGSINTNTEYAQFFSHSASLQLNAQINKKLSLKTYLVHQDGTYLRNEDRTERILNSGVDYIYKRVDTSTNSTAYANIDLLYDISETDNLTFQYRILNNDSERFQNNDLLITDDTETFSNGIYNNRRKRDHMSVGINYNKKLDTLGQELSIITDYYTSDIEARNQYINLFFNGDGDLINDNNRRSISPTTYDIISAQVDYSKPINDNMLELGSKISSVENTSNTVFEDLINGEYVVDDNFTNSFNYDEQIVAGYASYAIDKFITEGLSLQVGLRGEFTKGRGEIPNSNFTLSKDYFNLFPSVFLTKQLKNKASVGISYSRRINRPNYMRFNPTIFYITDFTSQVGNPDLDPTYTNALELTYNKSDLNVLLFFDDIQGEAREILTQTSPTELRYQWRNLDKTYIYGMSASYNKRVNDWWTLFGAVSWYGKTYKSTFADAVDNIDVSKGTVQFQVASQMKLPWNMTSEISFEYNGPETNGQFETGENYAFYINLSKRITKDLSFYLKITDPFDNLRYIFTNTQRGIRTNQFRNNFNTSVRLTMRYNFDFGGETKKFRVNKSNSDLRNRSN
ncbi:outer membrane beta-barrel protein [Kordia algicida OT-1]|uniref:Possible TonB-dependent receptor n=1 Tax=Kordia algicida OT-1 TaxID=391587 RepID=A9DVJ3_9FLAO|nr:outer membrane beta-barrel protein [Kordia algicida]EDP96429.1 possible TonB-dependent receptor [Kordia algicida OT-1]